jgi:hypothetical protein
LTGHPVSGRTRRPPRYTTVRGRGNIATHRFGTCRVSRRALGLGHARPGSQRRPHAHTHSTRTQPAIRSAESTITSRPRVCHGPVYTAGRKEIFGFIPHVSAGRVALSLRRLFR